MTKLQRAQNAFERRLKLLALSLHSADRPNVGDASEIRHLRHVEYMALDVLGAYADLCDEILNADGPRPPITHRSIT